MKAKTTRREAIKVLAAAGAILAAAPYLPRVLGNVQPENVKLGEASKATSSNDPLVVVVKDEELLAFRGLEEVRIVDSQLASQLNHAFNSGRGSD